MRDTGLVFWHITGSREVAARYMAFARVLLGRLKAVLGEGIDGARTTRLVDGTLIRPVASVAGDIIKIDVSNTVLESPCKPVPIPQLTGIGFLYAGNASTHNPKEPIVRSFPADGGAPYFFRDHPENVGNIPVKPPAPGDPFERRWKVLVRTDTCGAATQWHDDIYVGDRHWTDYAGEILSWRSNDGTGFPFASLATIPEAYLKIANMHLQGGSAGWSPGPTFVAYRGWNIDFSRAGTTPLGRVNGAAWASPPGMRTRYLALLAVQEVAHGSDPSEYVERVYVGRVHWLPNGCPTIVRLVVAGSQTFSRAVIDHVSPVAAEIGARALANGQWFFAADGLSAVATRWNVFNEMCRYNVALAYDTGSKTWSATFSEGEQDGDFSMEIGQEASWGGTATGGSLPDDPSVSEHSTQQYSFNAKFWCRTAAGVAKLSCALVEDNLDDINEAPSTAGGIETITASRRYLVQFEGGATGRLDTLADVTHDYQSKTISYSILFADWTTATGGSVTYYRGFNDMHISSANFGATSGLFLYNVDPVFEAYCVEEFHKVFGLEQDWYTESGDIYHDDEVDRRCYGETWIEAPGISEDIAAEYDSYTATQPPQATSGYREPVLQTSIDNIPGSSASTITASGPLTIDILPGALMAANIEFFENGLPDGDTGSWKYSGFGSSFMTVARADGSRYSMACTGSRALISHQVGCIGFEEAQGTLLSIGGLPRILRASWGDIAADINYSELPPNAAATL